MGGCASHPEGSRHHSVSVDHGDALEPAVVPVEKKKKSKKSGTISPEQESNKKARKRPKSSKWRKKNQHHCFDFEVSKSISEYSITEDNESTLYFHGMKEAEGEEWYYDATSAEFDEDYMSATESLSRCSSVNSQHFAKSPLQSSLFVHDNVPHHLISDEPAPKSDDFAHKITSIKHISHSEFHHSPGFSSLVVQSHSEKMENKESNDGEQNKRIASVNSVDPHHSSVHVIQTTSISKSVPNSAVTPIDDRTHFPSSKSINHSNHAHTAAPIKLLEKCFSTCTSDDVDKFDSLEVETIIQPKQPTLDHPQMLHKFDPENPLPNSWSHLDASTFLVRGPSFFKDKKKVNAPPLCLYTPLGVRVFKTPSKVHHILSQKHMREEFSSTSMNSFHELPPMLFINVQLPLYPPSLFTGPTDGEGLSLLIPFELNKTAAMSLPPENLGLIKKFIAGEMEHITKTENGTNDKQVRDRLKLIARLANPSDIPLGIAERKLIQAWNQKPVLTRPQHEFYAGGNYLEIDLDVHRYAFVMRKGIQALKTRFHTFEFDVALVVQSNEPELLPEHVLCCLRLHHLDILQMD